MAVEFSEQTDKLFKALADFQKEVAQPKKDADNPFFKSKYVPLENVVQVIHETGGKHGLSEVTYPASNDLGSIGVGVIITHSSGQYMKLPPVLLKPDKNTPQGAGAAITYARRYALSSAFGIASETDDDANSISGQSNQQNVKKVNKTELSTLKNKATKYAELTGNSDDAGKQKVFTWLANQALVQKVEDIPANSFNTLETKLNSLIKQAEQKS